MILTKKTPLWMAARGLLAERGADFFSRWEKVVETFDPEDIHDLRVASRRLREALSLFAPCYPDGGISRLRKKFGKVTDMLGDLRNIDEGLAFFRAESKELGADQQMEMAGFIACHEEKRETARKKLRQDLSGSCNGSFGKYFNRTVQTPILFNPPAAKADPFETIEVFARESMDRRHVPLLRLTPRARLPGEATAQHKLRIAVKKYRYRMEVLSPLMNAEYKELHEHVKEYQELLGRIHDLDVFSELVAGSGLSAPTKEKLSSLIAAQRGKNFRSFLEKLETTPFEQIGARVRSML